MRLQYMSRYGRGERLVFVWPQVLVQGCQLDGTDLDTFLQHIYQQLRSVENNIAEVLQQQHDQASGQVRPLTPSTRHISLSSVQ